MNQMCVRNLLDAQNWELFQEELTRYRAGVIFKKSSICSISMRAEVAFDRWVGGLSQETPFLLAKIDVIAGRTLARALANDLGVKHASPQVLWLGSGGEVLWHVSHNAITEAALVKQSEAVLS